MKPNEIYQKMSQNILSQFNSFKNGESNSKTMNENLIVDLSSICKFIKGKDTMNNTNLDVFLPVTKLEQAVNSRVRNGDGISRINNMGSISNLNNNDISAIGNGNGNFNLNTTMTMNMSLGGISLGLGLNNSIDNGNPFMSFNNDESLLPNDDMFNNQNKKETESNFADILDQS